VLHFRERNPDTRVSTYVQGLLGSFLWYRPGLCQCRFRIG
jgi:hypothetical protein